MTSGAGRDRPVDGEGREGREAEPYRILFVCSGNTCRSPMAEAIARRALQRRGWSHVEVSSAGVFASLGAPASEGARLVAEEEGLDLSGHRSAQVTSEQLAEADLVLVMTRSHLDAVAEAGGGDRAALLGAFAVGADSGDAGAGWSVPDPFGGDVAAYRATFEALARMVEKAVARLEPVVAP